MPATNTAGVVRKFVTRTLAAGALLGIYAVGMIGATGTMLTATSTSAEAQYYRGYRRGRGRGYRRGYRGRGVLVCRHRYYSSRRVCYRRW
jgi:hypothetical protein